MFDVFLDFNVSQFNPCHYLSFRIIAIDFSMCSSQWVKGEENGKNRLDKNISLMQIFKASEIQLLIKLAAAVRMCGLCLPQEPTAVYPRFISAHLFPETEWDLGQ